MIKQFNSIVVMIAMSAVTVTCSDRCEAQGEGNSTTTEQAGPISSEGVAANDGVAEDPLAADQAANPAMVLPDNNPINANVAPAPKAGNAPGKPLNLFNAPDAGKVKAEVSPTVAKIEAMIKEFVEINGQFQQMATSINSQSKVLFDKKKEFKGLEQEYNTKLGELANVEVHLDRLSGVLNVGTSHPQYKQYSMYKKAGIALRIELSKFPEREQRLKFEVPSLERDLFKLQQSFGDLDRRAFGLTEGWIRILNVFSHLSDEEAKLISTRCSVQLIGNDNLTPVRALLGFSHLHQGQFADAIKEFKRVLTDARKANNMTAKRIANCGEIGLIWAKLEAGELQAAGGLISDRKKRSRRDYELAICEGRLLEKKNQPRKSLDAFKRAANLAKERPEAYRYATQMLLSVDNVDPGFAVTLAKKACECDEAGDFRNQLNLAESLHRTGDIAGRDRAMDVARQQAGETNLHLVEERMSRFSSVAKTVPPSTQN